MLDDKNGRPRFRASNYQSTTRVKPFCTMSMRLDEGWNQIQVYLSDFTRCAYGTNNIETLRVQIHANCRIRRIYHFSDRLYSEEELPPEFKLLLPITKNQENSTRNIAQKPGKTLKSTNEESIPVSLNEEKTSKEENIPGEQIDVKTKDDLAVESSNPEQST